MKFIRIVLYIILAFANAIWAGISGREALAVGYVAQFNPDHGCWLVVMHWASVLAHLGLMFLAWGYRKSLSSWIMFALLLSPVGFYGLWKLTYHFYNVYLAGCENCAAAFPIF